MEKIILDQNRGEYYPNVPLVGTADFRTRGVYADMIGTALGKFQRKERFPQYAELQLGNTFDTDWDENSSRAPSVYICSEGDSHFFLSLKGEKVLLCQIYGKDYISTSAVRIPQGSHWYKEARKLLDVD